MRQLNIIVYYHLGIMIMNLDKNLIVIYITPRYSELHVVFCCLKATQI